MWTPCDMGQHASSQTCDMNPDMRNYITKIGRAFWTKQYGNFYGPLFWNFVTINSSLFERNQIYVSICFFPDGCRRHLHHGVPPRSSSYFKSFQSTWQLKFSSCMCCVNVVDVIPENDAQLTVLFYIDFFDYVEWLPLTWHCDIFNVLMLYGQNINNIVHVCGK